MLGHARVEETLDLTSDLRGWLFCITFVSIGLESRARDLSQHATGGRPIQLYVAGQAFNVVLTLLAAHLAFGGVLFDPIQGISAQGRVDTRTTIPRNLEERVDATALFYTEIGGWGHGWTAPKRNQARLPCADHHPPSYRPRRARQYST